MSSGHQSPIEGPNLPAMAPGFSLKRSAVERQLDRPELGAPRPMVVLLSVGGGPSEGLGAGRVRTRRHHGLARLCCKPAAMPPGGV